MADLSETKQYRTSIYAIYEGTSKTVVYVGLTDYERDGVRFIEHVNNDTNAPWHKDKFGPDAYQSADSEKWPYYPRKLTDCKDYTPLETAASEQYWWEYHGGLTGKLLNKQQPLTLVTFLKYSTTQTYRGVAIGFPDKWKPKQ